MIGCCMVVIKEFPEAFKVLAINCSKGRGIILPGGKYEECDEDFRNTAEIEVYEKTGVKATAGLLLFQGMAPDGFYDYCFLAHKKIDTSEIKTETPEGQVIWTTKLDSKIFKPYYKMVHNAFPYYYRGLEFI